MDAQIIDPLAEAVARALEARVARLMEREMSDDELIALIRKALGSVLPPSTPPRPPDGDEPSAPTEPRPAPPGAIDLDGVARLNAVIASGAAKQLHLKAFRREQGLGSRDVMTDEQLDTFLAMVKSGEIARYEERDDGEPRRMPT